MSIKRCQKHSIIFTIGGLLYVLLELAFRGRSHWTMFILGGLCFLIIGHLNESALTRNWALLPQMLVSSIIITVLEFIFGLVLNVWLGLGIWDYSNMPFNLMGQICLPFTLLWFLLSSVGIILDDTVRNKLFNEPYPTYHFI